MEKKKFSITIASSDVFITIVMYALLSTEVCSGGSRISRRGGRGPRTGGRGPRGGYVSKILHVKTKESGPVGGARAGRAPPRSANCLQNNSGVRGI